MLNVFQEVSGYQSSCVSVSHVIKNRIITVKKKKCWSKEETHSPELFLHQASPPSVGVSVFWKSSLDSDVTIENHGGG